MTRPSRFLARDVTRACAGAARAGLAVREVRIAPDGQIIVSIGQAEVQPVSDMQTKINSGRW